MKRGIKGKLLLALLLFFAATSYLYWQNSAVQTTKVTVSSTKLPAEFSGFTIAHVSDLHNATFGKDNLSLLRLLEESRPDIIVMTGDMIDSRRTDVATALDFIRKSVEIAPTYFVTGNHEVGAPEAYAELRESMLALGVRILEDEHILLSRGDTSINLLGLRHATSETIEDALVNLADFLDGYTILLAHHPELIGYYAGAGVDLVFSGHAHGGQIRLPFIGGIYSPGQGFFPVYDSGLHTVNGTDLVVSRGLGNSRFPFRVNNRPELVIAELHAKN